MSDFNPSDSAFRLRSMPVSPGFRARKQWIDWAFRHACGACTLIGVVALALLLYRVLASGLPVLDWQFLSSFASRRPEEAGIAAGLVGTVWIIALTAVIAVPVGIAAAVYLEEYAQRTRLNTLIEINIANLSGVPSIVYGILGLAIFVGYFKFEKSILSAALTLSLMILPVIIIAGREALRAVPKSLRTASYGLGATKWQTTWNVVLPAAIPGIVTGVILALSRAIGETAPIIMVGGAVVYNLPDGVFAEFSALPIQIYEFSSRPRVEFQNLAAAAIIVLLAVLFAMNAVAIWLRLHYSKKLGGI